MPTTESDRRRLRRMRGRRSLAVMALVSLTLATGGATAATDRQAAKVVRSAGISVTALQRALGIPADGVYGPQTRKAVRRFQRANGLTVDGIAGPQTLAALGLKARSASNEDPATVLARIAQCESGGDPTAVSRDRRYFGKYQFSRATWRCGRRTRQSGASLRGRAGSARGDPVRARGHDALACLRPLMHGRGAARDVQDCALTSLALGRHTAMMSRIEMIPWTSPPLTTTR